jgi:hypothetical protein
MLHHVRILCAALSAKLQTYAIYFYPYAWGQPAKIQSIAIGFLSLFPHETLTHDALNA